MQRVTYRSGRPSDERLLRTFLGHAIFVPPGEARPDASVVDAPDLRRYWEGWGRPADVAVVAEVEGSPVGAAWVRRNAEENPGYGFVAADVPEMTIAVLPGVRGRGIGTRLLSRILARVRRNGERAVSLSVDRRNRAVQLYERHGFVRVEPKPAAAGADDVVMIRHFPREPRVGLALGGGAARGIAHIGVLKVLHEQGVNIAAVAGTSVGSIVGALVCAGYRWDEIREMSRDIRWNQLIQLSFSGMGIVRSGRLEHVLDDLLGGTTFEELEVPLAVVAVDITTAEEVVLREGRIAPALRASSSVPGIFEPVELDERLLVDGGVRNNLPARLVRSMGVDIVIAVDLIPDATEGRRPKNIIDVIAGTFAVLVWNTSETGRRDADILIEPDIADIGFHELDKAEDLLARGEAAAGKHLQEIRSWSHR